MARKIPDALARRHLIEQDLSDSRAKEIAAAYLEEERPIDALIFLEKASDREGLERIEASAIEQGDLFLLRAVSQHLGREPDSASWRALARAASAAGKESYAAEAERLAVAAEEG